MVATGMAARDWEGKVTLSYGILGWSCRGRPDRRRGAARDALREAAAGDARCVTFAALFAIVLVVGRNAEPSRTQYREILRFVRRRTTAGGPEAEDVTQEAFVNAAEVLARSAESAPPTLGWLYTVARRRLIDEARRKRIETVSLELVREGVSRDDEYAGLVVDAFDAALATLPEAQRAVVVLRLLEGWGFAEIGARLDVKEETCRVRFKRGLEALRVEFEKEGLTP